MRNRIASVFGMCALALGLAAAAGAQGLDLGPLATLQGTPALGSGSNCAGGEIYDDGTVENGYSGNATIISSFQGVQRFTPAAYPASYDTVCVCLTTVAAGGPTLDFNIQVHDDDGAAGAPGTLLGSVPASAAAIPLFPAGTFYSFDISSMNLNIPSGNVWIGVQWNPMAFPSRFLCADQSATTPLHPGFVNFNNPSSLWQPTQSVFPDYRAKMVRALAGSVNVDADLAIEKTGVLDGDTIVYTVTVTNNGPDDAENVVVTDALPAEVTYVSDTCGGSNVPPWTWNVGTLANGASASCDITVTVNPNPPTSISNTASVTADQNDPAPGDESSTFELGLGSVLDIPTVDTLGLVALALLLGGAGLWWVARRRRTAG